MGWVMYYRACDEDYENLEASAKAFLLRREARLREPNEPPITNRHRDGGYVEQVQEWLDTRTYDSDRTYYTRLWHRCAGRALGDPSATGIAYGYIGRSDS